MIEAWRLVKSRYAETAFSGEGSRLYGGRWSSVGTPMVYLAGSLSLAELEVLVHLPSYVILDAYAAFRVSMEEALIERLPEDQLPDDWRSDPVSPATQAIGDAWAQEQRGLVLRVPSSVVPSEWNYLINPLHPDMDRVLIEGPMDPRIDDRLRDR